MVLYGVTFGNKHDHGRIGGPWKCSEPEPNFIRLHSLRHVDEYGTDHTLMNTYIISREKTVIQTKET